MNLERRFPCIDYMQQAAKRRLPRFAWDYMAGGIGREAEQAKNLARLDRVKLNPRYLVADADAPDLSHKLFDVVHALPFGVAPLGLSGIVWPGAAEHLARTAKQNGIPFALSGFATSSIEQIGAIGGNTWYQHYATVDADIQLDAAQSALDALPAIRAAVGDDFPLLADGGIRNGLDIARYLALGAHFVLLGRAFMFALGALGKAGATHAMSVLRQELRATLGQLGCPDITRLPEFSNQTRLRFL